MGEIMWAITADLLNQIDLVECASLNMKVSHIPRFFLPSLMPSTAFSWQHITSHLKHVLQLIWGIAVASEKSELVRTVFLI